MGEWFMDNVMDALIIYDDLSTHAVAYFFFSSRRRHTRCSRDWSSDVCSSDLRRVTTTSAGSASTRPRRAAPSSSTRRSEERRVGKECRSRWSPYHYKKKKSTLFAPRTYSDVGQSGAVSNGFFNQVVEGAFFFFKQKTAYEIFT